MLVGIIGLLVSFAAAALTIYSYRQIDRLFISSEPVTEADMELWHMAYMTWFIVLAVALITTVGAFTVAMNLMF